MAQRILSRALSLLPPPGHDRTVYLALSGGVDSTVAGFLLRERGYNVKPTLLRCWDLLDESSSLPCFEKENRAAEKAARALNLQTDIEVINLVENYWTDVFNDVLLTGLQAGQTPNADLACNKYVKFGAFPAYLKHSHGESIKIATGHYARLLQSKRGPLLLKGKDTVKDQSYFLASVYGQDFQGFFMPVGGLMKTEVRLLAEWAGLPSAKLKSSRGMCFVGKKPFPQFVNQFIGGTAGNFVQAGSNNVLGKCTWPSWAYTIGQRARIGGRNGRLFIVGTRGNDVVVADDGDWRLYTNEVFCPNVNWVVGEPEGLEDEMKIEYKTCSTGKAKSGTIRRVQGGICVSFDRMDRRVADGQAVVLYDKEICLGAAWPRDLREWDVQSHDLNSSVRNTSRQANH